MEKRKHSNLENALSSIKSPYHQQKVITRYIENKN
jgi:hypothetical protein